MTDASTPDFSLVITPSSVSVKQGLTVPVNVTLNRLNGFAGAVTVTLGNPPAGLTAASLVIPAGSSTGKLNVSAGAAFAPGSGSTTVKGVSGALSHNANLSWTILSAVNPDFALGVIGGVSVIQGNADGVKVNLDRQNGFAGPVIVTLTNPPAGITAAPLTIPGGSSSEFFEIGVPAQVPVGTVNLTLSGTGGGLTRTLKQVLTVVAGPDKTAPTLVSSSPANNATAVSVGTGVILTFSEAMNPNLTFASFSPQAGGTNSHWLNGNTTLKLNLVATVPGQPSNVYKSNTAYTLSVEGEDEAGNTLSGTKTFKFTTQNLSDTTAPTVLDTIPAAGAQGVAPGLGKTFTATFSEKLGSSVLNPVNFVPNAGATSCVFTDSSNKTVQCTPTDGLLGNQFYIMTITTAAKDEVGNPLAQLNAVSFNTGPTPDMTKPKIKSSQPSAATPVIDTNTGIAVYFPEAMDKVATQAAFTFITPVLTASQSLSFEWGSNGDALFIKRSTNFTHSETVTWKIGAGAKDVSGNMLEAASTGTHSFKIYTLGSFKLYSDGSLDGQANSKGVAQTLSDGLRTQAYSTFYTRGFISFDLQQLPSTAT